MPDNNIGSLLNTFDSARSLRQNQQAERPARGPAEDQAARGDAATDRGSAVNVDLSPRAREILAAVESDGARNDARNDAGNGRGNGRAGAPGQVARQEGFSPQDGRDFGQAVSSIARGIDPNASEPDDGTAGDGTAGPAGTSGGTSAGTSGDTSANSGLTDIAPSVDELIDETQADAGDRQSGFDAGDGLSGNEGTGLA